MSRKDNRPPLGGLNLDDDVARIRDFGLSRGFLPTDPQPAPPAPAGASPAGQTTGGHTAPLPSASSLPGAPPTDAVVERTAPVAPLIARPAPTRPWQAMLPDYLVEALRQAAAIEGTAQKVIVLRALKAAGFRVDDIDLQDLRKR